MIFDPSTAPHLKPWLVRTLEPICDAEPGALADYILALLKHNVPENEMRKELQVQLDEFLENECASFVDTLFTVLRTKSYLPYAANPPSPPQKPKPLDTGIPIPLDGLISPSVPSTSESRPRKRSIETDDRDIRPPAKGPRLNSDGQFSRYGGNGRQDGRWNERGDRTREGYRDGSSDIHRGPNGALGHTNGRRPQSYQPPDQKRGICRDYHNYGYCARGALCKYSHGDDAVVPGQLFPSMPHGLPFLPMFPNGAFGPAVAYDPHEARMDMRPRPPHQRAPLLPRIQQEDGSRVVHPVNATGELPVIQDLTPSLPPDSQNEQQPEGTDSQQQQQPQQQQQQQQQQQLQPQVGVPPMAQMMPEGFDQNGFTMAMGPMNGFPGMGMGMGMGMDVDMAGASVDAGMTNNRNGIPYRGSRPHRGRGRGTFSGEVHNFRPERHTSTTLVVEKIPQDKLSLEQVNDWFKRFGTVTNVAIDAASAKALVSFSKHEEAHAAWKSEDAVFSNRFVKVFWHRPMEGHGQVGARLLAASAPLVASMQAKDSATGTSADATTPSAPVPPATPARKPPAAITSSTPATTLAARQKLLEQQIAEQKSLMTQFETASGEEKKEIMIRLRKLGEEMKKSAEPTTVTPTTTAAATSSVPSTPTPDAAKRASGTPVDDRERLIREKLDRELEMHNAVALAGGETADESGESMDDLKVKLEKLKAEAASLGISETVSTPGGSGYRGWYRGRGRGVRNYYRGGAAMRGGPPRASMKLDNRPKRLLVKGTKEEHVRVVREWYNATSQVESVDITDEGDLVVSFRSRPAAEQGLAKGTNIPNIGSVQLSWYTGAATMVPTTKEPLSTHTSIPQERDARGNLGQHDDAHHPISPHEEEVVASGWGGDDDGDGMGMI